MKFIALAVSAVIGLAAAQMEVLSEIPQCALQCFTESVTKTDCALTDFYCQCGANAEMIQKTTLECLCHSECTTSDLAKVYSVSTKLCTKVLEQHGEKYDQPAALSEGICAAGKTPAASSGNSTGSAKPSSNTTSSSASPSGSGAAYEGGANSAVGMSMAAIAVGGLAFLAM
ncbi:hypothetical protein WHR41_02252 [Cladosporium halotolerans]|uniref:CFEM domain-containing protein n=1 Tax=Cladosporium halotolerans TaxID=1052096 RepID=A0AB34KVW0_9PEZI